MIALRNKLYESLLDDEEDLINSIDDRQVALDNISPEFYDFFKTFDSFNHSINDIPVLNKDKISYKETLKVNKGHKPFQYYIPDIKTISAKNITLFEDENSKTLCKNLNVFRLNIYAPETIHIKDININIDYDGDDWPDIYILNVWGKSINPPVIFENVNIKSKKICNIAISGGSYLPKFQNVKCKNLYIDIYNSCMSDNKSLLDDIDANLDMNYTIEVLNLKTKEIKSKNKLKIKSISPLVRNLVYKINQPIAKFKEGTKITDIFKDLHPSTSYIHITMDKAIEIIFDKKGKPTNKFKINEFIVPLSDGWFMEINCKLTINAKYIGKTNWGYDL